LKFIDAKHPGHTSVMAAAAVVAFMLTPSIKPFISGVAQRPVWTALQLRLLPRDHWFGVDWRGTAWLPGRPKTEVQPADTSPISTGSISVEPASPDSTPKQ
jgi:hypothetical protein